MNCVYCNNLLHYQNDYYFHTSKDNNIDHYFEYTDYDKDLNKSFFKLDVDFGKIYIVISNIFVNLNGQITDFDNEISLEQLMPLFLKYKKIILFS